MTLQLQPLFKRSIRHLEKNDSDLGDQAVAFGKKHEFADIVWYPSQNKVVYRIDDRVSTDTPGNGVYDFLGFRAIPSQHIALARSTGFKINLFIDLSETLVLIRIWFLVIE